MSSYSWPAPQGGMWSYRPVHTPLQWTEYPPGTWCSREEGTPRPASRPPETWSTCRGGRSPVLLQVLRARSGNEPFLFQLEDCSDSSEDSPSLLLPIRLSRLSRGIS